MADLFSSYDEDLTKRWDYHKGPTSLSRQLAEEAADKAMGIGAESSASAGSGSEPNSEGNQLNPTVKAASETHVPNPLEALSAIGETLGAPLRMLLVKTLTGQDPTATGKDGQYTGQDFKTQLGLAGPDTPLGKQALGLGAEILTDPTSALPIGGKGAQKAVQAAGEGVAKGAQAAAKYLQGTSDASKVSQTLNRVVPDHATVGDMTKQATPQQTVEDAIKADPSMSKKKQRVMRESVGVPTDAHGKNARAAFLQKSGEDHPLIDEPIRNVFNYTVDDSPLSMGRYQFLQDITREESARTGVPVSQYQNAFRSAAAAIEADPTLVEKLRSGLKDPAAASVVDHASVAARVMGDETGGVKAATAMLLARVMVGASIGGAISEDKLQGALTGAGIALTPEAMGALIKTAKKYTPEATARVQAAEAKVRGTAPKKPSWNPGYAEERFNTLAREFRAKKASDIPRPLTAVEEEAKALLGYQDVSMETLARLSPNAVVDDASMRAAQLVLKESGEHLRQMAMGADIGNPDDVREVLKQLYIHGNADLGRKFAESGLGRALNVIDSHEADQQFLNQMTGIVDEAANGVNAQRIVELIRQTASADHLAKFANSMQHRNFKDMAVEYWANGLLSSPKTWVLNQSSSALFHGLNMFERGASVLYGNMTGPQESIAMMRGTMAGLQDGFRLMYRMLKDETVQSIATGDKIDLFHPAITGENVKNLTPVKALTDMLRPEQGNIDNVGTIGAAVDFMGHVATKSIDAAGKLIRLPRRIILAQDEFTKTIGMRAEIYAGAVRNATADVEASGLTGKAARELYTAREKHWLENPSPDTMRAGKDYASYIAFNKELGKNGQAIRDLTQSSIIAKAALPFVTAPINVTKSSFLERTPLGIASETFRAELRAGGQRRQLALTRMSMGASFMALATQWVANGFITNPSPDHAGTAKALKQTGEIPFGLNLSALQRGGPANAQNTPLDGDKIYDLTRLEPGVAPAIVLAALYTSYRGKMTDDDAEAIAGELAMAVAEYVGDKSWFAGAANMVELISDPTQHAPTYLRKQVPSLVPFSALSGAIAREVDPVKRNPMSVWQGILTKFPYLSKQVIPDRNRYGEIVHYPPALGPDMASPFYTDTVKSDPVLNAMRQDEFHVQALPKRVQGIELTPEQYDQYRVIFGQEALSNEGLTLREAEEAILKQASEERRPTGPDSWRANQFEKVTSQIRTKAQKILLRRNPELAQQVVDHQRERMQGMGEESYDDTLLEIEMADEDGVDVKAGRSKALSIPFTVR